MQAMDALAALAQNLETLRKWPVEAPNPSAIRCQESRHRTLAHLRACQEQWLIPAIQFAERDAPNVKILHPWRQFESLHYDALPWEEHLRQFEKDREAWIRLLKTADLERGGKWNGKPDTIAGLAKRLAEHETYHLGLVA